MKKLIFISGLIFSLFINHYSLVIAQSGWFWQNPYPYGGAVNIVKFINANTGFVGCDHGFLLTTFNGGLNWALKAMPYDMSLKFIYATNDNTIYIGGNFETPSQTYLKTTNNGLNWNVQTAPTSITSFYFFNANTGYASTSTSYILHTTNGGTNWDSNYVGLGYSYRYINFLNINTGYICGVVPSSVSGRVLRTTNGGTNWIEILNTPGKGLYSIWAVNDSTVIVSGYKYTFYPPYSAEGDGMILRTTNNCNTWDTLLYLASLDQDKTLYRMNFFESGRGYAYGPDITLMTDDGGLNWYGAYLPYLSLVNWMDYSANIYYYCGDNGYIYKSTNNGGYWINLDRAVTRRQLYSVYFLNDNTGFIGGGYENGFYSNYIFLKTTNGGIQWDSISSGNGGPPYNVQFPNNQTGYAAGNHAFFKTNNGGLNWTKSDLPNGEFIATSLFFCNSTTGYLCTKYQYQDDTSIIYKTTNGVSWIPVSYAKFGEVRGINFFNENTGIIATSTRKIYRTTNGGMLWDSVHIAATYSSFQDLQFVNNLTGYASTSDEILKSTNGGLNWVRYNTVYSSKIFFTSPDTGYTPSSWSTYNGIYKTCDGGYNWQLQKPPTNGTFRDIFFSSPNTGYAVGDNGMIMKTTTGGIIIIKNINKEIPQYCFLYQNYPNPFNPVTKIKFEIPSVGQRHAFDLQLKVYDILGREVQTLVNEQLQPGTYEVTFDGSNLPSGIYFYQLKAGDYIETRKMILLK